MEQLTRRDEHRVFALLADLYAGRTLPDFISHVLTTLSGLIPCDRLTYNEIDTATGAVTWTWHSQDRALATTMLPVIQQHVADHPAIAYQRQFVIGQFATHQISHTKGFVAAGKVGGEGSTNRSTSGEGKFVLTGKAGGPGYKAQKHNSPRPRSKRRGTITVRCTGRRRVTTICVWS